MEPSTRTQNIVLAAMAALAVGTSAYALWSVNQPHPSLQDRADSAATQTPGTDAEAGPGGAGAGSTSPGATASDPAGATSGTDAAGTDAAGTDAAGATDGAPATGPAPPAAGLAGPVADWVAAWQGEADLLVLGDGHANEDSEWVQAWGDLLGRDRPVTIRHWGEAADQTFNPPLTLAEGAGDPLRIWSGSRAASTIGSLTGLLPRMDAASADPDAILVALGSASVGEDVPAALDALLADLPPGLGDAPVLVLVGPAGHYDPVVADALADWAAAATDRFALVDLRESAPEQADAQEWAQALQDALTAAGD